MPELREAAAPENKTYTKCFGYAYMKTSLSRSPSFAGLHPSSLSSSLSKQKNPSANTKHERVLRSLLWKQGLRYRKNVRSLPGKPDLVFTRARLVVFCDGDFWHGRTWPALSRKLKHGSNSAYWIAKIKRNRERDKQTTASLRRDGWTVLRVWETDILRSPEAIAENICRSVMGKNTIRAREA
jgi:DNA mismatch endonuclease, patch repair protein